MYQVTKYYSKQLIWLYNELNEKVNKVKISERMNYNVENTYSQTLQNEQQIISDLSGKITEEILKYIYLRNLDGT